MPSGVTQYAGKCCDLWADADSSLAANGDRNVATQKAVKTHANPNLLSVYAAGTAYQLTASAAALDFGTTDPSLTLTKAGTYLLTARVRLDYNGATFSAVRTATLKLRRTNNTAADLSNGSAAAKTQVVTTTSGTFADLTWSVLYTTTNTDDAIALFGSLDVVPSAGSLDAVEASIVAVRLAG